MLLRGRVPSDILFLGEAPGASEDVSGKPFYGPAGHLLDKILAEALPDGITYAITNLVGCIPKIDSAEKIAEPPDYAIETCMERVKEVISMTSPRLFVTLGKLARKWLPVILGKRYRAGNTLDLIHPAAILRADISQQGLAIQRCIVSLREAATDLL